MGPIDRRVAARALRALIGLTLVCTAWFAAQAVFGQFLPVAVDWVALCLVQALLLPVCWQVGTSPSVPPAAARYWRTVTYALAVMGIGVAVRMTGALLGQSWADAGQLVHVAGVLTIVFGLARLPMAGRDRSGRRGLWLDFAITLCAAAIFIWHAAAFQALRNHGGGPAELVLVAFLMSVALAGVFIPAKVVLTGSDVLPSASLRMIGLGYLCGGVGSALGVVLDNRPGINPFLLALPWAGLLTTLAAQRQLRAITASPDVARRRPQNSLLPYAAVTAVCVLLIHVIVSDKENQLVIALGMAVVTVLVVVRQILAFRDNEGLVAMLDTSLLELRLEEERVRLLVQNSTDIVVITELDNTVRYISPAVERLLGHDPAVIVGTWFGELAPPEDQVILQAAVDTVLRAPGASTTYQVRARHVDDSLRWFEMIVSNLAHEPSIGGMVTNCRDITETRAIQDKLSFDASHDVLTGLANRALFGARVAASIADARPGHRLSIVLIDLDDFKSVNDTLGHAAGDTLLVAVADRMRASVRPGDTVARLGGDEFAILFEGLGGEDVDRVLVRIAEALLVPVQVDDQLLSVRASFGVADTPSSPDRTEGGPGRDDAGDLLRRADIAMYEAKERGEGGHQRYTPGMEARGAERSRLNSALREALERDELLLHFQPVVSLPDGRLTAVEALVRWRHPVRGLLAAIDFLPGAEQTGLIVPVGHWVLRAVCRQAAAWRDLAAPGSTPVRVSMNVSARELKEPGFAAEVADALHSNGLPPGTLVVEFTETTAGQPGAVQQSLRELRDLGVRLALDGFGTGASTLSLLATCPVDQIKLDRSFATGADALAGAAVQLARALEVEAVAHGVETAEQAARLHGLGYEQAQGFFLGRPMPAEELTHRFTESPASLSGRS